MLLGWYLDIDPCLLHIFHTSMGKPYVMPLDGNHLYFSLSHSAELAVYGVTRAGRIGVDTEYVSGTVDGQEIARRFFSAQENLAIDAAPTECRHNLFYQYWTLKEAYLKGIGTGLTEGMSSFHAVPDPTGALYQISHDGTDPEEGTWTLRCIQHGPDYVLSVAVEAERWDLKVIDTTANSSGHALLS